jgi:hypothetical protein
MTTSTTPPAAPATDLATTGHTAPPDAGRRRFRRASLAGGLVAVLVLAWFATRGFSTLFDEARLGGFFDGQARSLFHGHWDVPPGVATFERFNIDGRFYMYFGPAPALLRVPILLVTDALDGRLSRASMLAACIVFVLAIVRLSWLGRRTVRGDGPVSPGEAIVAAGVVVVGACGTIVPYLAGWPAVYHEAIAWGVAFALVSYGALVAWLLDNRTRDLVLAAGAAVLSVLARGSVGFGPVAAIGIVLAIRAWAALGDRRAGRSVDWRVLAGLGAAALVPLALYGYVNAAKFGAPFAAPPHSKQDLLVNWPPRAAALAANDGSLFGWQYAPTILLHALRPDGVELDRLFPWALQRIPTRVFGDAVFDNFRPTTSLTAASPLPLLAALAGVWLVAVRRGLRRVWVASVLGTIVGAVGAVSIAAVDQRFQGDALPALIVPGVIAVWVVVDALAGRSRWLVGTVVTAALVIGAWSVWVNLSTAFVYQRAQPDWSTVDDRASLVKTQLAIQDLLDGLPSRVATGAALPPEGQAGDLFVLGDCAGVHRHDGAAWLAVEQTPTTGYHPLRLRLDRDAAGRQPVLSSTDDLGTAVLWARNRPDDRVGFEYQWKPHDPANEFAVRVPLGSVARQPDGSVEVSVRVDPREGITDFLQVRADGERLYDEPVTKLQGPVEIGGQDTLPGATSLAGSVERRPADTPLCDRLVALGLEVS